jgi:hypothetical protein
LSLHQYHQYACPSRRVTRAIGALLLGEKSEAILPEREMKSPDGPPPHPL